MICYLSRPAPGIFRTYYIREISTICLMEEYGPVPVYGIELLDEQNRCLFCAEDISPDREAVHRFIGLCVHYKIDEFKIEAFLYDFLSGYLSPRDQMLSFSLF
ncbi:MAG: hypothetical protein SOX72_06370 [Oscillospiraceae bacterium]|nr:hypothetical protein [Oscillospiraceae bacterium]MDY4191823.1 hypothetical protein [Oscillospiraceae bacterium]